MKEGDASSVEAFSDVSILYARFITPGDSVRSCEVDKSLDLFNDLIIAIGDAAEKRGVERVSSDAITYVACCGLSRERLDHASRVADFAQDVLRIVGRLHRDRQVPLHVHIGIDSGPAAGGIVGRTRFSYHLSGETLKVAAALASLALIDSILVSERIHTSTEKVYQFGPRVLLAIGNAESVAAWPLKSTVDREPGPGFDHGGPISSPAASHGAGDD
jgi:class 3 adenylate cyclase